MNHLAKAPDALVSGFLNYKYGGKLKNTCEMAVCWTKREILYLSQCSLKTVFKKTSRLFLPNVGCVLIEQCHLTMQKHTFAAT